MLALKIIATVFIGISFITALIKNMGFAELMADNDAQQKSYFFLSMLYSCLWRALVIVALWVR